MFNDQKSFITVQLVLFKVEGVTRYILLTKDELPKVIEILEKKFEDFLGFSRLTDVFIVPGFFYITFGSNRRATFSEIFRHFDAKSFDNIARGDFKTVEERKKIIEYFESQGKQDSETYRYAAGRIIHGSYEAFDFTDNQMITIEVAIDKEINKLKKQILTNVTQLTKEELLKMLEDIIFQKEKKLILTKDSIRQIVREEMKIISSEEK